MINRKLLLLALPALLAIGVGGLTATSVSAQSPTGSATATSSATTTPTGSATPAGSATPLPSATAPPRPTATVAPAVANCPAGASITLTAPSGSTPLTASVSPSTLNLKLAGDNDPTSFHIHYIVDRDPFTFLVNGQPVPFARDIVHTNSLTPDLSALLTPGRHKVWAILTRQNHINCSPIVEAMVDFAVGAPGAPGTGTDMTQSNDSTGFALIVGGLMAALAGGALLLRRR